MNRVEGFALCLIVCTALAGCGNRPGDVTGTVTFDGAPVADGALLFVKDGGTAKEGAVIRDGRFQTKLPPGKYMIEVNAQKVVGKRTQKGFDGKDEEIELKDEMIPERYNSKTELSEEIKPGPNPLKFDLKSKK